MIPRLTTILALVAALAACGPPDASGPDHGEEGPGHAEGDHDEERPPALDRVTLSAEAVATSRLVYATAEELDISPSLELPAEVVAVPDRRATVGPRAGGRVVSVAVNVGDAVAAGTALAVLESAEVGQVWASLVAARARASAARRTLRRLRQLRSDKVASERSVDEAAAALQVAEAEVQAAITRLTTYGVVDTERLPDEPGRVTLTSPIAGTVVARAASVGQWVDPAATMIEVVDLEQLWLEAAVYERELRFVRVGQPVEIELRAFPGEVFPGEVAQIGDTFDPRSRSAHVRVVLANPGHRVRPGMSATARVLDAHAHAPRRLLAIPWAAVQEIDGHVSVFVRVGDGEFTLHRVHIGERAGELVEVLNGVAPGDVVVADGSFLLKGHLLRGTLGEHH
ncbi:MAG: hypothetical protein CVU56_28485 [Deltaproteobacteria bacterium HGW-Deltaproteobacteria-14]|jgi:cobalt-zinc-cadmium efflux system membrane fusion protein|nr:MAG: hypothetical protein CVU56_28485 [Deltaproteobacteria bacterium HGW-Deltaproteobacteria-14]